MWHLGLLLLSFIAGSASAVALMAFAFACKGLPILLDEADLFMGAVWGGTFVAFFELIRGSV